MSYPEDCPCRHESPEHCPCETIEEIELTDDEFNAIVDSLNGETTWPPRGN